MDMSCSICKSGDNVIFYGNIAKYFCRRCFTIQKHINYSLSDLPDEYVHDINYRLKIKYAYDDGSNDDTIYSEYVRVPVCFTEDDFGDDNELNDKSLFSNGSGRLILSVKLVSVRRKVAFLGVLND